MSTGSASPAPNANGWNNTPVTVTFTCSDALSGLAPGSPPPPTTLSSEGAGQSAAGICTDVAGNSASATVSNINIDLTAPEAYTQFDVASRDIAVFGRDALSGVSGFPVAPSAIVTLSPIEQQRTYNVTDLAGNVLRLVLRVHKSGRLVTVRVTSTKYGDAAATTPPLNLETYNWNVSSNGTLLSLNQTLLLSNLSLVQGDYNGAQNQTTVTKLLPPPMVRTVQSGLVLLRMATVQGNLQIEY